MSKRLRIQDAVHKTMDFGEHTETLFDLLNTPEFHRLRSINQLGLANYVYPSAEHSRFSHSLGTAFITYRFWTHFERYQPEELRHSDLPATHLRLAAVVASLCHDLGHGPLSHAWERDVLTDNFLRVNWAESLGVTQFTDENTPFKWHEMVTLGLLLWPEGELHQKLERVFEGLSYCAAQIIARRFVPAFVTQLISADIDSDRADYLRRDSHMCGLKYGDIDIERLIDCSSLVRSPESNEVVIAFDVWRAKSSVEHFLQGRAQLYESVYFHKTIRSAEKMVGALLRRLAMPEIAHVYRSRLGPLSNNLIDVVRATEGSKPIKLMQLHDRALWACIEEVAMLKPFDITSKELATRILSRNLMKVVPLPPGRLDDLVLDSGFHSLVREAIRDENQSHGYHSLDAEFLYDTDRSRTVAIGNEVHGGFFATRDGRIVRFRNYEPLRNSVPTNVAVDARLYAPSYCVAAIRSAIDSTYGLH